MNSIADGSVMIQTSSKSFPCPPPWWGELVLLSQHLRQQSILAHLTEGVRFARRRFGHYEVIDFLAVLFGYAISGERTLEEFYEAVQPFASVFMALFGRDHLPARSTLSRFLASLPWATTDALRTLFLADLLARPLDPAGESGGLLDRQGSMRVLFDLDGTRQAARQRALPQTDDLPAPQRRLEEVCAAGYTGRKRGQVVRTRTVAQQAHSQEWLGTWGNPGNGHYREELRRAVAAVLSYLTAHHLPLEHALVRLDGQYGTAAVLADLAGLPYLLRGQDYHLLDRPEVQARLHLPPDQTFSRPQSALVRQLYDCPDVAVGQDGSRCRVIVATHPAPTKQKKRHVGHSRDGLVYELFLTSLPQESFTAADLVALYLHRGAFETTLFDEDQELDPDRWCSRSPAGQEAWQIISQWLWNLRLELGHHLDPEPVRTTEFAPALTEHAATDGYDLPTTAAPWKAGRFSGKDFLPHPDGTLRCPAGKSLWASERRSEADGSLRVVYEARIGDCRPCLLREQCQWYGKAAIHPRRVSMVLHPRKGGTAPLLWKDWSRRKHRQATITLLRRQRVDVQFSPPVQVPNREPPAILSRAQRAHARLSWYERLARNAHVAEVAPPTITLHGIPGHFAAFLGLREA